jgi:hypothetical protein
MTPGEIFVIEGVDVGWAGVVEGAEAIIVFWVRCQW